MKLHILHTGFYEGGAQSFARRLASENDTITCTINAGNLRDKFQKLKLPTEHVKHAKNKTYEIIVLSDIRALVWFLFNPIKAQKKYFIPHSNKLNPLATIILLATKIYKIEILPTTPQQKKSFFTTDWYRLICTKKHKTIQQKQKLIVYWGRNSPIKRINKMISDFGRSQISSKGWKLLIIGAGKDFDQLPGVQFIPEWVDQEELRSWLSIAKFSINYTKKSEGISLLVLESLKFGIIPLVSSTTTASNFNLSSNHIVDSSRDFTELDHRDFEKPDQLLEKFNNATKDIIEALK